MEKEVDSVRLENSSPGTTSELTGVIAALNAIDLQLIAIRAMIASAPAVAERVFTTAQAAAYCGVKPVTIRRWVHAGKLSPEVRGERNWRFRKTTLDQMSAGV